MTRDGRIENGLKLGANEKFGMNIIFKQFSIKKRILSLRKNSEGEKKRLLQNSVQF
jgi:hypothetical protein